MPIKSRNCLPFKGRQRFHRSVISCFEIFKISITQLAFLSLLLLISALDLRYNYWTNEIAIASHSSPNLLQSLRDTINANKYDRSLILPYNFSNNALIMNFINAYYAHKIIYCRSILCVLHWHYIVEVNCLSLMQTHMLDQWLSIIFIFWLYLLPQHNSYSISQWMRRMCQRAMNDFAERQSWVTGFGSVAFRCLSFSWLEWRSSCQGYTYTIYSAAHIIHVAISLIVV